MSYSIILFMNLFFIIIFENYSNTHSIWSFFQIIKFSNLSKLLYFGNFIIFQIKKLKIS